MNQAAPNRAAPASIADAGTAWSLADSARVLPAKERGEILTSDRQPDRCPAGALA